MATARAAAIRSLQPAAHRGQRVSASMQSFRATDQSRTRVRVRGGSGDRHADARTRKVLRDLSQDLERNAEPYMVILHGFARLIGAPAPRPLIGGRDWRARVTHAWRKRGRRTRGGFDARGIHTWDALCTLWWRLFARDGDVAAIVTSDGTISTIEAERIDGGPPNGNQYRRTVGGITLDANDCPRSFWVAPRNAHGIIRPESAVEYLADQVQYLVAPWSYSQTRGIPMLAAGLDNAERVDALVESEIISSEQASNLYGWIKRAIPAEGIIQPAPLKDATEPPAASYVGDNEDPDFVSFPAGSYWDMPAGLEWQSIATNRPNLNTVELLRQIMAQSCAATGFPFAVLFADFRGVNWSGNRGLVSLTRDAATIWRQGYCEPFIAPFYEWWLRDAIATKQVPWPYDDDGARVRDEISFYDHAWDWPDIPEWPDPYKEEQTHELALRLMTTSRHRILGPEWDAVMDEIHHEECKADQLFIKRLYAAAATIEDMRASHPNVALSLDPMIIVTRATDPAAAPATPSVPPAVDDTLSDVPDAPPPQTVADGGELIQPPGTAP